MWHSKSESTYDHRRLFETLADPVFVLDASNPKAIRIVEANAACLSFFGAISSHCRNRLIHEVLPAPAALRLTVECECCIASRLPVEFHLDLRSVGGKAFGVQLNAIQHGDEHVHIAVVARAASVHCALDPDARAEQFRVIAEHAADYISRCDCEGRVLYLNPAVERLMGARYETLVGMAPEEWAPNFPQAGRYIDAVRRAVATGRPQTIEMHFIDPASGQIVYHQVRYAPEWNQRGEVVSVIGIGRDITPLKAADAELRMLNATLEERVAARTMDLECANRDLRNFASTVSHDLRAPLRVIAGYAHLMALDESERLSDSGRTMLEKMSAAVDKLDRMIAAILSYSQAGQRELTRARVSMEAAAREVSEELLPGDSPIRIDIADLPAAYADATMVRQILQNLIGNAIKFSVNSEQPRIEVGWYHRADQVVYYVRDNGVGFDMQYAGKLFAMFERLHGPREFPGSGVGLATVKRLVERHGGTVWAESLPGISTTFFFTLSEKPRTGHQSSTPLSGSSLDTL